MSGQAERHLVVEIWFLRNVQGVSWMDGRTGDIVLWETDNSQRLTEEIGQGQSGFFGCVMRRNGLGAW